MIIKNKIDPWSCMPLLGTVEFFKDSFRANTTNTDPKCTTRVGFQPLMDNPILWDQFDDFRKQVQEVIDRSVTERYKFVASWFVSYDKTGKQETHKHTKFDSDFSGVVCLMGNDTTGALCFESEKIYMKQGDIVIFTGDQEHWTEETTLPKSILSFDCKYI
jgi:hypothetical protein